MADQAEIGGIIVDQMRSVLGQLQDIDRAFTVLDEVFGRAEHTVDSVMARLEPLSDDVEISDMPGEVGKEIDRLARQTEEYGESLKRRWSALDHKWHRLL